jgi:hypothetical protein
MALPSTMQGDNTDMVPISKDDQKEDCPPLLNFGAPSERWAIFAPKTVSEVRNSKTETDNGGAGRVLIVNGNYETWFQPSNGLTMGPFDSLL